LSPRPRTAWRLPLATWRVLAPAALLALACGCAAGTGGSSNLSWAARALDAADPGALDAADPGALDAADPGALDAADPGVSFAADPGGLFEADPELLSRTDPALLSSRAGISTFSPPEGRLGAILPEGRRGKKTKLSPYGGFGYEYSTEEGCLDLLGDGHGFGVNLGLFYRNSARSQMGMSFGFEGGLSYSMFNSDVWGDATIIRYLAGVRIINANTQYYLLAGVSMNELEFDAPPAAGADTKGLGFYAGFGYKQPFSQGGKWNMAMDTKFHLWDPDSTVAGSGMTLTVIVGVMFSFSFCPLATISFLAAAPASLDHCHRIAH